MNRSSAKIVSCEVIPIRAGTTPPALARLLQWLRASGLCVMAFFVLVLAALVGRATGVSELDRAQANELFTNGTLSRLSLEIPEASLRLLRSEPREYVRGVLRDGGTTYSNVAVHLKGGAGSFRQVDDQPGFTVSFTHFSEAGPRFHGLKKIHLNNSVQDPTRVSEWVASDLFRKAGVPAARVAHTLCELNGRSLGLYLILEAMDKDFLSLYFKNPHGNLYGQTPRGDVTEDLERMEGKGPEIREDLHTLAAALAEPNAQKRLERIEQVLDVNRFLSFMALEVIFVHHDGYTLSRHNFRLYHDPETDRFVFLPHDMDQLMKRGTAGLMPQASGSGAVALAVLGTPELRARYRQRVSELATNLFRVSELTNRVDQAAARLVPALAAHEPSLAWRFTNFASEFKERLASRGAALEAQLAALNGAQSLKFLNGIARLNDWWPENRFRNSPTKQVKDPDGKVMLWIGANGRPIGKSFPAWRTQLVLEVGHYRFEGMARCAGIQANLTRRNGALSLVGACLGVPDHRQTAESALVGDSSWRKLSVEFDVLTREDVELICELRAVRGEVWFDRSSLQLVRLR